MIFQSQITELDSELTQLQSLLNSVQQRRNLYSQFQQQTDGYLKGLSELKGKLAETIGTDAIASLKSAVVSLFNDGDNDSDGNQPDDSPKPPGDDDDGEPDLLAFNGITGDYLLFDGDEPEKDNPLSDDHVIESGAGLNGQVCHINPDLFWAMSSTRDGSAWDFATPICCLLEDAPASSLTGQSYELCSLLEDAPQPFVELVVHSDNPNVAYIKKTADGQILTAYFGFRTKAIAQSWKEFLEAIAHRIELRKAKQVPGASWEIKAWGMAMNQIDRLTKSCNFSKPYQPQAPKTESPAVELGVMPPSDWGKVNTIPVLEENDICEVLQGRFTGQVGTVAAISQFSEKPIALNLPGGHIKHFLRSELKFVSKGESKPQRQQFQSGQVLMGDRIITSGNYIGVAATLRANNAARGLDTKLAATQLMKAGLSPELAMAAATGNQMDDASDF